jgi:hypothetical protein
MIEATPISRITSAMHMPSHRPLMPIPPLKPKYRDIGRPIA